MKIKYNLTLKDQLAFHRFQLKRSSFIFKNYIFLIAIAAAVFFSISGVEELKKINDSHITSKVTLDYFLEVLVTTAFFIGVIFLSRSVYMSKIRNRIISNKSLIGSRELEINEDNEIILKTGASEIKYDMDAIKNLIEVHSYYFIFLDTDIAIILPKNVTDSIKIIGIIRTMTTSA
jgi:hypothetical protein